MWSKDLSLMNDYEYPFLPQSSKDLLNLSSFIMLYTLFRYLKSISFYSFLLTSSTVQIKFTIFEYFTYTFFYHYLLFQGSGTSFLSRVFLLSYALSSCLHPAAFSVLARACFYELAPSCSVPQLFRIFEVFPSFPKLFLFLTCLHWLFCLTWDQPWQRYLFCN